MTKIEQIQKMFQYLIEHPNYDRYEIRLRDNGEISFKYLIRPKLSSSEDERENKTYYVNFDKKKITMYGHNESHHNGDHYDCFHKEIEFDFIEQAFDSLKEVMFSRIKVQVEQEKNDELAKIIEGRINKIINPRIPKPPMEVPDPIVK